MKLLNALQTFFSFQTYIFFLHTYCNVTVDHSVTWKNTENMTFLCYPLCLYSRDISPVYVGFWSCAWSVIRKILNCYRDEISQKCVQITIERQSLIWSKIQKYDSPYLPLCLAHVPPLNNRIELSRTWRPENNHNPAFTRPHLRIELTAGHLLGQNWNVTPMLAGEIFGTGFKWHYIFRVPFKAGPLLADKTLNIAKTGHMWSNSAKFGLK